MANRASFTVRSALMAIALLAAGCGAGNDAVVSSSLGATDASKPTTTTTTTTTVASTTATSTVPSTTSSPKAPVLSSVTVTDPTGDVVVEANGFGSLPDYDPRADLVSYTLSWTDVVRFTLTPVETDPAKLVDVWLGFDTDADTSGLPDFAVFDVAGTNALYELQDMWTFACPVSRSIVEGSYIVEFDAACLGDTPEIRLRSPYSWFYGVSGTVTGTTSNMCAFASETNALPEWNCLPSATYTDEMSGSGPVVRSP